MINTRNKKLDWWISRIPISTFILSTVFNIYYIYFHNVAETVCTGSPDKLLYLANELEKTLYIGIFIFIAIRLKFCAYNWVSIVGLAITNIVNIYAILFPIDYEVYTLWFIVVIDGGLALSAALLFIKAKGKITNYIYKEE